MNTVELRFNKVAGYWVNLFVTSGVRYIVFSLLLVCSAFVFHHVLTSIFHHMLTLIRYIELVFTFGLTQNTYLLYREFHYIKVLFHTFYGSFGQLFVTWQTLLKRDLFNRASTVYCKLCIWFPFLTIITIFGTAFNKHWQQTKNVGNFAQKSLLFPSLPFPPPPPPPPKLKTEIIIEKKFKTYWLKTVGYSKYLTSCLPHILSKSLYGLILQHFLVKFANHNLLF